jgi:hypothetical protein
MNESDSMLGQMGTTIVDGIVEWANETIVDPFMNNTKNHRRWATGVNGQILMSNEAGKTIRFDQDGVSAVHTNAEVSEKYSNILVAELNKL